VRQPTHGALRERLVSKHEAALLFSTTPGQVLEWCAKGWIPEPIPAFSRHGNGYVWDRLELERWIEAGCPSREVA